MDKETQAKCKQSLIAAENEAQRLVDEATEKASELYSQIKIRTDSLKKATELECQRMRDDADAYVTDLRTTVENETNALKATTEEVCKKTSDDTLAESKKLLENARTEVHDMMMEANSNYRRILADAEERSNKLIFEAENRAALAKNEYENILRKTNSFRKNMNFMLKSQMELMQGFEDEDVTAQAEKDGEGTEQE